MPFDCDLLRTNLAKQTPVYDEKFLQDFIGALMVSFPFLGRHQTRTWTDGKDTILYDKMHVQQPNVLEPWQRIGSGANDDQCFNSCEPPRTIVSHGTTRDSAFMEQKDLQSQPWCLQDMRGIPHIGAQIKEIYSILRKMPAHFMDDFLRTRFTSYHDTLQIAGSAMTEFSITTANTDENLTTINLGSTGNLPTSKLTLAYLEVLAQQLFMEGYDQESSLPAGTINLVTHDTVWNGLKNKNPGLTSMIYPQSLDALSPLYKIGKGISATPFGFIAPTFDRNQIRFQTDGSGLLQRVLPYLNVAATTGGKPERNPAWFNARYGLSYILHPQAAILYTPSPRKIHEMVPSVNSAMFGKWRIKDGDFIEWQNPDGTVCQKSNPHNFYFYWLAHMEAGFRYDHRNLVMPILHLLDGSGAACLVNDAPCGTTPQYVVQDYDGIEAFCEE